MKLDYKYSQGKRILCITLSSDSDIEPGLNEIDIDEFIRKHELIKSGTVSFDIEKIISKPITLILRLDSKEVNDSVFILEMKAVSSDDILYVGNNDYVALYTSYYSIKNVHIDAVNGSLWFNVAEL